MALLTRRQVNLGLVAAGLSALAGRAYAHHGWGGYDAEKTLTLNGTVVECKFLNPHGEMRLQTAEKIWLVTLAPPFRMQNRGLTEDMLKPGSQCTAVGYVNKSDANEIRAERVIVAGKTVELR